jgi:hypothetical protein
MYSLILEASDEEARSVNRSRLGYNGKVYKIDIGNNDDLSTLLFDLRTMPSIYFTSISIPFTRSRVVWL